MELIEKIKSYQIVLASQSPRRQDIFRGLNLNYTIRIREVDESFPSELKAGEIARFLAEKKSIAQRLALDPKEILVTADTIVWIKGQVLNKPLSADEARSMLQLISGNTHRVFTGVCLATTDKSISFVEETEVTFHALTEKEIDFYLEHYKPLDKAGAYGIQEFIGYIGIKKISGDFYNVVGFPVQRFWKELDRII